ncbi:hypothetical protein F441_20650 [Phytophthora nicotianae CJ01A1]|uniref:FAR1 domain-containing protein n=2 Tax=Phytophthora nicotianae TaxID=4792 RepID=W2FQ54_PHYNI|nr:hypothetical protein L915_20187 [Phytophthora nicotianae]ETL26256.1 hypothetical protein L916_20055 [Phytophthora nicotianae]ETP02264.1 hypothetical protein F441_20650 [Phytophthora nicotianae CJ01A1]
MADPVKENTDSAAQDGDRLGAQSSVTASKDTSTREKKRKRPSGALPPLPIYNRAALEAHRAEKIARARIDQQETRLVVGGRQRMTRKAAAVLRNEDGGAAAARASEQTDPKQWEKVALKEMFGIGFDSQSDTAAEVSSSEDSEYVDKPRCPNSEVGDDSSSQISVDDEPEEESERASSDGDAGEDVESAAAAYTESSESDAESTLNLHQNTPILRRSYDLRVRRAIPSWFRGFKATYKSWHRFHKAFDIFQFDSFQRFTNRTTTSVATRNKQIVSLSRARKRAGKQSRKEVTLIPEEWQMYSKTMVCTHGQPYEPKGKGKRRHNNIRDTKCKARVNVRVTVTVSGSWYLRVNGSGEHNHALTKHSYDNYAQNRTVKDPQLTDDVAILHKAGANAHGILQYLRERTGMLVLCGFGV